MDLEDIFKNKVSESSRKLYIRNLKRLNDGKEISNFKFLNDSDEVLNKISHYKPNTRRSYIISIVSLLKTLSDEKKKFKKLYETYYDILDEMNVELRDQTKKTKKESIEWEEKKEIESIFSEKLEFINDIRNKKKLNEQEWNMLLYIMTAGLFLLQAPRRNKDYQELFITKNYKEGMDQTKNYLDVKKKVFVFNVYKTKKTYKTQIIDISSKLLALIKLYLKFHPLRVNYNNGLLVPFLVNFEGSPLPNNNSITRILYKVFNKKIGSSMLRKIYLTDKYKDVMENLKEDASSMGTSTSTIQNNYIKK